MDETVSKTWRLPVYSKRKYIHPLMMDITTSYINYITVYNLYEHFLLVSGKLILWYSVRHLKYYCDKCMKKFPDYSNVIILQTQLYH